jgi:hypothetical protein
MLATEAIHTPRNSAFGCEIAESTEKTKQRVGSRFFIVFDKEGEDRKTFGGTKEGGKEKC